MARKKRYDKVITITEWEVIKEKVNELYKYAASGFSAEVSLE